LLSNCESQQIFGPARFAPKLLIYLLHKYCLLSALLMKAMNDGCTPLMAATIKGLTSVVAVLMRWIAGIRY